MAVDANVLIYERIRDEERAGQSPLMAMETGFKRASVSILDANVTTLISAVIMFMIAGSGPVKGAFAWTLGGRGRHLGLHGHVCQPGPAWLVVPGDQAQDSFRSEEPSMRWPLIRNMPHHFSFDFVKLAPFAAASVGLADPRQRRVPGRQALELRHRLPGRHQDRGVHEQARSGELAVRPTWALHGRARSPRAGLQRHHQGADCAFQPVARRQRRARPPTASNGQLAAKYPDMKFGSGEVDQPKGFRANFFTKGMIALAAAVGPDAALYLVPLPAAVRPRGGDRHHPRCVPHPWHPVAVPDRVFLVSVPALLTVIGYTMNEKVITFDRSCVRTCASTKEPPLRDVINLSENERLSRTLITGSTALLALAGLLFLGGPALFPMILTMVVGIILGTYSSIYVALPVILLWGVKRNDEEAVALKPMTPRTDVLEDLQGAPRRRNLAIQGNRRH